MREGFVLVTVLAMFGAQAHASAPAGRYVSTMDTVHDVETGLTWQRAVATARSLSAARTYCQTLNLGGFSTGWRLPSAYELATLVDIRVTPPGPTIDATAFPGTPAAKLCSATLSPPSPATTFLTVDFRFGNVSDQNYELGYTCQARCVR